MSFIGRVPIVQKPSSLLRVPPEWDQAPKDAFAIGQMLHDHLEPALAQNRDKFIVRDRDEQLFPAAMPVLPLPFVRLEDSLHGAAQSQDLRRAGNVL